MVILLYSCLLLFSVVAKGEDGVSRASPCVNFTDCSACFCPLAPLDHLCQVQGPLSEDHVVAECTGAGGLHALPGLEACSKAPGIFRVDNSCGPGFR